MVFRLSVFLPLGHQSNFFCTRAAHGVDDVLNVPILRTRIRAEVNCLVGLIGQLVADAAAELGGIDLVRSQKHRAVAYDSHDNGVFLAARMVTAFSTLAKSTATMLYGRNVSAIDC